jgi:pimeloyl-ACP methyl ester carboxylesterase
MWVLHAAQDYDVRIQSRMKFPAPRSVDTSQVQVHYFDIGNPAGTPVILLHGFPDAPIAWGPTIDQLDIGKLRLIVPYLRGYGSTRVLREDLVGGQEAALGQDLLAFADALSLERFHLAGHDWGARTAYAACIFAPSRILSLFTLATPYIMYGGKDYPPEQINANWYQWYFQLQLGQKALTENTEAFCRQLWRSWSPNWNFAARDFTAAAAAWKNPQFVSTVLHYYRTRWGGALSLRAYSELQATLNAQPKAKITVPSIYVQGADDACDLPPCSEHQASFFTAPYKRILLKGSGHFPHREDPKAIASHLSSLIRQHS